MESCIILCGGMSRRMGRDKGSMVFDKKPMIIHVLEAVENIADEIIIVLRDEKQAEIYKKLLKSAEWGHKDMDLKICTDIMKDQGPLGGILTGLTHSMSNKSLILPCDSPFIRESFVLKIFSFYEDSFDAVVPRWPTGDVEPLHAIYKKESTEKIEELLRNNIKNVKALIERSKVKFVDAELLDETGKSFQNINRMRDIKH